MKTEYDPERVKPQVAYLRNYAYDVGVRTFMEGRTCQTTICELHSEMGKCFRMGWDDAARFIAAERKPQEST